MCGARRGDFDCRAHVARADQQLHQLRGDLGSHNPVQVQIRVLAVDAPVPPVSTLAYIFSSRLDTVLGLTRVPQRPR